MMALCLAAQMILSFSSYASTMPFTLHNTVWEHVSESVSCKPDPLLLYSLALQETKHFAGKGYVAPHPLAMRNEPRGAVFPKSIDEARSLLPVLIQEDKLTDIGIMQINYRWNGQRVKDITDLLDMKTNIRVAAEILCESIAANPANMLLAIGGYHTPNPRQRARATEYARSVLHIWRSLQNLAKGV